MAVPPRPGASAPPPRPVATQMAPPPRPGAAQMAPPPQPVRVGLPHVIGKTTAPFMTPQFSVPGRDDAVDVGGSSALRHRVVPPAGLGAWSQQFDEFIDEFNGPINSGYYFSNLMSAGLSTPMNYGTDEELGDNTELDDDSVPDDTPIVGDYTQPTETQQTDDIASAKGSQGRTKNFSVQEDLMIVSGWLNVSMDPIRGVDQSKLAYWKRVHEYYHLHKTFTSDRSQGSLMNCWSTIRHDVNAFCGCISKIEARNQSGCTVDDKIASACALYKEDDKNHKNFSFLHCWKVLKDKPKWLQRNKHNSNAQRKGKKQKTSSDASPSAATVGAAGGNGDDGEPLEGAQERPLGKKKELQRQRQRASMEAVEFLVANKKEADV